MISKDASGANDKKRTAARGARVAAPPAAHAGIIAQSAAVMANGQGLRSNVSTLLEHLF